MPDRHPSPDRRRGTRFLACFPGAVVRPDGVQRPALIRNLSLSGALILMNTSRVAIGDRVELQLFIHDDLTRCLPAPGTVVRVETIPQEQRGPWLVRVAVHFDDALNKYESQITAFRKEHVWEED